MPPWTSSVLQTVATCKSATIDCPAAAARRRRRRRRRLVATTRPRDRFTLETGPMQKTLVKPEARQCCSTTCAVTCARSRFSFSRRLHPRSLNVACSSKMEIPSPYPSSTALLKAVAPSAALPPAPQQSLQRLRTRRCVALCARARAHIQRLSHRVSLIHRPLPSTTKQAARLCSAATSTLLPGSPAPATALCAAGKPIIQNFQHYVRLYRISA